MRPACSSPIEMSKNVRGRLVELSVAIVAIVRDLETNGRRINKGLKGGKVVRVG